MVTNEKIKLAKSNYITDLASFDYIFNLKLILLISVLLEVL
jgi:hypothetical protein